MSDREVRRGVSLLLNGGLTGVEEETLEVLGGACWAEIERRWDQSKVDSEAWAKNTLEGLDLPLNFRPHGGILEHVAVKSKVEKRRGFWVVVAKTKCGKWFAAFDEKALTSMLSGERVERACPGCRGRRSEAA